MKANYTPQHENPTMNRKDRRAMKERLKPQILRIVELEKMIQSGVNKEAAEKEIADIMDGLSLLEMMAVEDYIYSKNLL